MGSISIEHIADLESSIALRVVSSLDRHLAIETTVRKKDRIATIDLATGGVSYSKTEMPLLNLKNAKWSGQRWATAKNSKSYGVAHTAIAWQDHAGGKVYCVEVRGEKCMVIACPGGCDSVFIGTRKDSSAGEGRLYHLREGDVGWSYHPTEIAEYPLSRRCGESTLIHAYPYRIACSGESGRTACAFLNYLYVLNSSGELLKKLRVGELLEDLFGKRFFTPTIVRKTHEMGDWMYVSEINVPVYEQPMISALVAPSSAATIVFAAKNALVWLAPSGEVAHCTELPIGRCDGVGSEGEVIRLKIASTGRIAVAEVCMKGFCVLENGKPLSVMKGDTRGRSWDINEKYECIAVLALELTEIELFDWQWKKLRTVSAGFRVNDLWFSEDGRFLVACGSKSVDFALR